MLKEEVDVVKGVLWLQLYIASESSLRRLGIVFCKALRPLEVVRPHYSMLCHR